MYHLKKINNIITQLKSLDYNYLSFQEEVIRNRKYLQKVDQYYNHLFHLHIVTFKGKLWNEYILVRNYLKTHPLE